jgi:hypothetical protein
VSIDFAISRDKNVIKKVVGMMLKYNYLTREI